MKTDRRGFTIPSLDGLRAVSIAIVFLSHNQGLDHVFSGELGVTVFFVLSGYLITTLLREEHTVEGRIDLRAFYVRRAFRIFPPLYTVLLVAPVFVAFGFSDGHLDLGAWLAQWVHLANYWQILRPGHPGIPGTEVLWSLAVEEHFYLVFPVLYMLLLRRRLTPMRQVQVLGALCLAVFAWRLVLVEGLHVSTLRTGLATDTRLDSLLFGCMAALVANPVVTGDRVRRARLLPAALAGGCAVLATLAVRNDTFRETVRYTVQPVAIVAILRYVVALPSTLAGRVLNAGPLVWLGQKSYGFYLVHLMVLREVEQQVGSAAARLVVALVVSVFLAWVLHALLDGPSHALRRRALARVSVMAG